MKKWLIAVLLVCASSSFAGAQNAAFYLDPDYSGAVKDGSPAHPWRALEWSAVNAALAAGDITVYFSARRAAGDADQVYGAPDEIDLTRKAGGAFTLTLDGRSFYNANDAAPDWRPYSGKSMAKVRNFNAQNSAHLKYSNITIDGFRISMTASGKAVDICGDNWVVRRSDIFHTAGAADGPLVQIVPTADGPHEGSSAWCPASSNITIESNVIHDSSGELIYAGGGGCSSRDPGGAAALCMGFPSHDRVTLRGNVIYNGGVYGGQGDGIDVKGGYTNLKIVGNTIYNLNDPAGSGVRAIVHQGARDGDPDQNNLIADNDIHDVKAEDAAIALVDTWGTPRGVEVRNNVIAASSGSGIKVYSGTNLSLNNNTIYRSGAYGLFIAAGSVALRNNLLLANNSGGAQTSLQGTLTSSHNAYSNAWSGACVQCISDIAAADLVDPGGSDFHLPAGSKAKDAGLALSGSFTVDKDGVSRPQGAGWDIGAYEYVSSSSAATPSAAPKGLQLK